MEDSHKQALERPQQMRGIGKPITKTNSRTTTTTKKLGHFFAEIGKKRVVVI